MTKLTVYAGEDFNLTINALQEDGVTADDLSGYDILVQLSVEYFGTHIIASTQDNSEHITITRESDSELNIYVGHELTENLPEGDLTLSIMLIDKVSNARIISEVKTINIKQSKLSL